MLEVFALLVGAVQMLRGVGLIATIEPVVQVLLWGQIVGAVLMVLFMGIIVIAAALGFGLTAALKSGSGVVGLLAGLASGVGAGAVSLVSLIWYALRKGLVIAGCLLILQGIAKAGLEAFVLLWASFFDSVPMVSAVGREGAIAIAIGQVLYLIGFLWCWRKRFSLRKSSSSKSE